MYHKAVMIQEVSEGLSIRRGGIYVDATFGGGGHSRAILQHLGDGRLIAFDQDTDVLQNIPDDPRIVFLNHNFRYLKNLLRWHGVMPVDGILADLGVSSHQIDVSNRGFSTRFDGPLDMRMNQQAANNAHKIVNNYPVDRLASLFFLYGELRNARKIAETIEKQRASAEIETTKQLTSLLSVLAPRGREIKFMAQVFQALRIEVNNEMDALREFLTQVPEVLKSGGRLAVIAYHSLEDRLVKNFIKAGNFEGSIEKDLYGNYSVPLKKVSGAIKPSDHEIRQNRRSRSAILRIAEKTSIS